MDMDVTELHRLAADYVRAGSRIAKESRTVVQQHAIRTKQGMAKDSEAAGSRFRGLGRGVDYTLRGLNAEIGWRPGGVGSLAHIAAFGAGYSGPLFDHTAAHQRELKATERFLADLGVEVLGS